MESSSYLVETSGERTPIHDEVVIGRAPGVTLWLDDPAVSRRHAVVRQTAAGVEVEDLHSANGTYVNDELIQRPTLLRSGDRITIGTNELTFEAPALAQPALPAFEEPDAEAPTILGPAYQEEAIASGEDAPTLVAPFEEPAPQEEATIVGQIYAAPDGSGSEEQTIVGPVYSEESFSASEAATQVSPLGFEPATEHGIEVDEATLAAPVDTYAADQSASPDTAASWTGEAGDDETLVGSGEVVGTPAGVAPQEDETLVDHLDAVQAPTERGVPIQSDAGEETRVLGADTEEVALPVDTLDIPARATASPPNPLQVATRIARLARENDDLETLLRGTAAQLASGYQIQAAAMYLATEDRQLQCGIADGPAAYAVLGTTSAWGEGPAGRVASENQARFTSDRAELESSQGIFAANIASLLAAPLVLRDGSVVGVLELVNPLWKPLFDGDDIDFLTLLVQQLAAAAPSKQAWTELSGRLEPEVHSLSLRRDFLTTDVALRAIVDRCTAAVQAGRPVYLSGEPGTGCRHLARIASRAASGVDAPFVELDCSLHDAAAQQQAIFGEPQGAWSRAAGGMLYLSHAASLDRSLLVILMDRLDAAGGPHVVFSGSEDPAETRGPVLDAQLQLVGDDHFRLPPLRMRPTDIALLARHFVGAAARGENSVIQSISPDALERLETYSWPGNVAELSGLVLIASILGDGPVVTAGTLARLNPEAFSAPAVSEAEAGRWERVRRLVADLMSEDRALQEATLPKLRQLPEDEATAAYGRLLTGVESAPAPTQRARRLELLARGGDARVARYVAGYLRSRDPLLRDTAIVALTEGTPPAWVNTVLRDYAVGEDVVTAAVSVLALGRLRDRAALPVFERILQQSWDWKVRAAVAAALTNYEAAAPDVRPLLQLNLRQGEVLPSRLVRQARSSGVLNGDDLRMIISNAALPADTKVRLIQLVGQGDESGLIDLLSDLAYLPLEEIVQQALGVQIARRGEPAVPVLLRLIGSSNQTAQAVGLTALRQLPAPAAITAALRALAGEPALLRALRETLASHPHAFSSVVVDHLYSDWRLQPVLQLLRVLAATHGEELGGPLA